MPFFTSTIGIIKHTVIWLTSGCSDYVHKRKQDDSPEDAKKIADHDVAVYCIHGTFDRSSSFSLIADRIKSDLIPEVKSIHLLAFDGRGQLNGIEFFANQLKNKIISNKHKNVIVMGHSRGSIVASYFTEYLAKQNGINVDATINICGPFGGTNWAFFPLTASASVDQMRVGSPFLKDLIQKMKISKNNYYYFSASNDSLVTPSQAFIEEHAKNVIELDTHGHLSIMWSKRLADHIQNIINNTLRNKNLPSTEPASNVFFLPVAPPESKPAPEAYIQNYNRNLSS